MYQFFRIDRGCYQVPTCRMLVCVCHLNEIALEDVYLSYYHDTLLCVLCYQTEIGLSVETKKKNRILTTLYDPRYKCHVSYTITHLKAESRTEIKQKKQLQ